MIVKICGLTLLEDALAAAELGANMLGFNFYPKSPRYISPTQCAKITSVLKARYPELKLVGVFVNSEVAEIRSILGTCILDLAQLSGDEPPAMLLSLGSRAFKALRPENSSSLAQSLGIYPLRRENPAFLIDAFRKGDFGGTGQTADWSLASQVARKHAILLAGGLTPENVASAIQQVHPWGVDVASGVEKAPAIKDLSKIRAFIQAVRQVPSESSPGK